MTNLREHYLFSLFFLGFRISCALMSFWYGLSFKWFIFRKSSKKKFEFYTSRVTKSDESLTFLFRLIGKVYLRDFSSNEIFHSYFFIRTINSIIESLID